MVVASAFLLELPSESAFEAASASYSCPELGFFPFVVASHRRDLKATVGAAVAAVAGPPTEPRMAADGRTPVRDSAASAWIL